MTAKILRDDRTHTLLLDSDYIVATEMTNKPQLTTSILLHYQPSQGIVSKRESCQAQKIWVHIFPNMRQDGEAHRIAGFAYVRGLVHAEREEIQVQAIKLC